eukprot:327986_1
MPPLFQYVVRFSSIRSIKNEANYFNYIHAMTSFNYVVANDDIGIFADKNYKIKKEDVNIVNKLLKKKQKNDLPLYITNLFNSFTKNKVEIKIKLRGRSMSIVRVYFHGGACIGLIDLP